jgi:hypothetical protein
MPGPIPLAAIPSVNGVIVSRKSGEIESGWTSQPMIELDIPRVQSNTPHHSPGSTTAARKASKYELNR